VAQRERKLSRNHKRKKREADGSKLTDWPPFALPSGAFNAIVAAGKLDGLPRSRSRRLLNDLGRAAVALRWLVESEKRSIPSKVERELRTIRSNALRLHTRLNDLDPTASSPERRARAEMRALLAEALTQRSHAEANATPDPERYLDGRVRPISLQEVARAAEQIEALAAAAERALAKSKGPPKHEKRVTRRQVVAFLAEAFHRATRRRLGTGYLRSRAYVQAFFREVANVDLNVHQIRRLHRAISPRRKRRKLLGE